MPYSHFHFQPMVVPGDGVVFTKVVSTPGEAGPKEGWWIFALAVV